MCPLFGTPFGEVWTAQEVNSPVGKKADYFPEFGVASCLRFLVNSDTITDDLETSPARRDELDVGLRVFLTNLSRQTGGSGLVASKGAVFDSDFHSVEYREQRITTELQLPAWSRMISMTPRQRECMIMRDAEANGLHDNRDSDRNDDRRSAIGDNDLSSRQLHRPN